MNARVGSHARCVIAEADCMRIGRSVDMRAGKVFLLIGLLVLCALLVVFFMALQGENESTPLAPSITGQP